METSGALWQVQAMAWNVTLGVYGDPDCGGMYCSLECAERHAEDQEMGVVDWSEESPRRPDEVCDRPHCVMPLS